MGLTVWLGSRKLYGRHQEDGMIEDTYRSGFEQGFRAVKGRTPALPAVPARPATPAGKTEFQVGILKGFEAANRR